MRQWIPERQREEPQSRLHCCSSTGQQIREPTETTHVNAYPCTPFPNGWYQVAWSTEVKHNTVVPLHCLGLDVVLMRTSHGKTHVLEAHCPHLGAHLGVGGRIEDNGLVCPFHGWRFASDGQCISLPYASKMTPKARLRPWPVVECGGVIYLWHAADQREPN